MLKKHCYYHKWLDLNAKRYLMLLSLEFAAGSRSNSSSNLATGSYATKNHLPPDVDFGEFDTKQNPCLHKFSKTVFNPSFV